MTAGQTPRVAAVLDGTSGAAERQARALGALLRDGMAGPPAPGPAAAGPEGVTLVFYADDGDRERLVRLAPTRDVHLLRTLPRRPDLMTAALARLAEDAGVELFVFAGGPLGTQLATSLACRTGGGVVTDALDVAVRDGRLLCRRSVYSGHLTGRFELAACPWCVAADAGWYDAPQSEPIDHRIVADTVAAESLADHPDAAPSPLTDVELLDPPATGDLEAARLLVVAGRGAGGREGVERLAASARRMGAAFGVTRPVAMNAWAPMDRLIGVSGARAAPAACLVAGASGAPAFLWGIERAGFIAAVDIDEHAAIVTEADAVVLGDCVAVIEELAGIVVTEPPDPPG